MRALLAFVLVVGLSACAFAQNVTGPQPTLPRSPLSIETANGPVNLTVELANTDIQRQTGMMFRRTMAANTGMLFDFGGEAYRAFWMKNTLIPLDMIFIRGDGTIAHIAANAVPLTEDSVPSTAPVRAVLEIPGGRAAALGLAEGNAVRHAIFGNAPEG